MSSTNPIPPQQRLMASWEGRALDDVGLVRVLNENGSRPPLFWIFNSADEPGQLAKAVGPDQPLVFSRSLHMIARPEDDMAALRQIIVDHLLAHLLHQFPATRFDMGTSCQGSAITMMLANRLRACGSDVGHLCMINCTLPQINTDLPALLIYGDNDRPHNPFERLGAAAHERARTCFSSYRKHMLNACHGQYYSNDSIAEIVAQFEVFKSDMRGASSAPSSSMLG